MATGKSTRAKFDAFVDMATKASRAKVRVGIFVGQKEATEEIVEIATIHEFGTRETVDADGISHQRIVARSYIRSTMKERRAELQPIVTKAVRLMTSRKLAVHAGLSLIGAYLANAIKTKIVNGPFTPLKPATIARKGSDKPLIDTAQMKNSVTFVIID